MAANAYNRKENKQKDPLLLESICSALNIDFSSPEALVRSLPFAGEDTTVGLENEFQTVVMGPPDKVDLPLTIRSSNYFKNIVNRVQTGDNDPKLPGRLIDYLEDNPKMVWENSWVRFPMSKLSTYAKLIFHRDLLSDKHDPKSQLRTDSQSFFVKQNNENLIRVPVSYLLKLALADVIGKDDAHGVIKVTGERLMGHYLSDNTSPEILSFHVTGHNRFESAGESAAKETMTRFLLTQVLTSYANRKFGLIENGQTVYTYFSATPPVRQKHLNDIVPDSFYRELFMSPCLSGWDKGEEKKHYMGICHRVLSRSQMNAVSKLKDAGIITRNLVVMPNMSNISLANNGTHVSMGSKKLSRLLNDSQSGFTDLQEKHLGDLVIKITEHFLPLFVNTYSGSPYRLSFSDFHPEKVLAFLPHELDFTHLRMIWRRWKKKASIKIFGRTITPFGPEWMDKVIGSLFRLKGDLVPDFRLIDYFASLMSSAESPALDGCPDNDLRLKKDLSDMGIFDVRMALYMLFRLRKNHVSGYSGFEGRYYSIFSDFRSDLTHAVNLQMLITALSYQYILTGQVSHKDIPDNPFTESERRQIFFGAAIGLPTVYIHQNSKNLFLSKILQGTKKIRKSRRYPLYIRVIISDYLKSLMNILNTDGKELARELGVEQTLSDLENRLKHKNTSCSSISLTKGIMAHISQKRKISVSDPLNVPADEFNHMAEDYYRTSLRQRHMEEACAYIGKAFEIIETFITYRAPSFLPVIESVLGCESMTHFFTRIKDLLITDNLSEEDALILARLLILKIHLEQTVKDVKGGYQQETDAINPVINHQQRV